MALLKQSTAYTRMFLLVQTADHLTGLTGATPVVNLSKAGGAFAAAGGTITEVANGFYKIALTTTDTNTVGDLAFHITATSGDATDFVDQVSTQLTSDLMATYTQPTGFLAATFPTGTIANQTNITAGTIATVTGQLTAAQIATGVWQDAVSSDFTAASSIGKSLYTSGNAPGAASGIALVGSNMGTITGALTASQIATGVWTDTTAGDFTTALSIGKSVMNGIALGTGLTINDITTKAGYSLSGTQAFNLTGNITGNITGALSGSVGSVTARVTANADQFAGQSVTLDANNFPKVGVQAFNGDTTAANSIAKTTRAIGRGTASGVPTTTSIPTSAFAPAGAVADQFKGRIVTFDADTTTTALRGQATDITASSNAATPTLTVTALTTAPVAGDTFSIT